MANLFESRKKASGGSGGTEVYLNGTKQQAERCDIFSQFREWNVGEFSNFSPYTIVLFNGEFYGVVNNPKGLYKFDGTSWNLVRSLNASISFGVVYNNKIHFFSINESLKCHSTWDGTTWTDLATPPIECLGAVVYQNKLHIFNQTKHYTWNDTTWTELADLPDTLSGKYVVYLGKIHLLGGSDTLGWTKHYTWNGTTWTELAEPLPYPLNSRGAAVVFNGEIHIIGTSKSNYERYYYKWNGNNWIFVSNTLSFMAQNGSALVKDDTIYYFFPNAGSNPPTAIKTIYKMDALSYQLTP